MVELCASIEWMPSSLIHICKVQTIWKYLPFQLGFFVCAQFFNRKKLEIRSLQTALRMSFRELTLSVPSLRRTLLSSYFVNISLIILLMLNKFSAMKITWINIKWWDTFGGYKENAIKTSNGRYNNTTIGKEKHNNNKLRREVRCKWDLWVSPSPQCFEKKRPIKISESTVLHSEMNVNVNGNDADTSICITSALTKPT